MRVEFTRVAGGSDVNRLRPPHFPHNPGCEKRAPDEACEHQNEKSDSDPQRKHAHRHHPGNGPVFAPKCPSPARRCHSRQEPTYDGPGERIPSEMVRGEKHETQQRSKQDQAESNRSHRILRPRALILPLFDGTRLPPVPQDIRIQSFRTLSSIRTPLKGAS